MLDDQAEKSIKLLEKIAKNPVDPSCAATAWLAIGHAHRRLGDASAAAQAYGRAVAEAPEGSLLRQSAQSALDGLNLSK
jgi:cytochrome c-type biogenesis protein CcmH/NrfG